MELSGSGIKNFLIFLQKKVIFIFWETETPKKFLVFQETELFYISGTSYISGSNFPSSKKKHSEKTSYILGNGTF